MTLKLSPEQAAFKGEVSDGHSNVLLEAVAGAGKTFSILGCVPLMRGSVFIGAYNRKIADEIKTRLAKGGMSRRGLVASTMHGAGFSAWSRVYPGLKVSGTKVGDIIRKGFNGSTDRQWREMKDISPFLESLVSLAKQSNMGVPCSTWMDPEELAPWTHLIEHYSLESQLAEGTDIISAVRYARFLFKESEKLCNSVIDFDDMIWAPLAKNASFFRNDWVVCDEVQDFNPARIEMVRRMLMPSGRFIGVGDDKQAIYGFTGAAHDAMDRIAEMYNCKRMSLSVSFRCPKAVVKYARNWVSHIYPSPTAQEGEVIRVDHDDNANPWYDNKESGKVAPGDAVLCRYTAPLVANAMELIRMGTPAMVEGRDIGVGILKRISHWKSVTTTQELQARLEQWVVHEEDEGAKVGSSRRGELASDMYRTIMVFVDEARADGHDTLQYVKGLVSSMFGDPSAAVVTFCTGHRSKGREWPKVYWLEVADSDRKMKDWEIIAEDNVKYVMATRAQETLVVVEGAA